MKKKWMIIALCLLLLAGCGSKDTVTKADNQKDAAALVNEFYEGLAESDPIMMKTSMNGEVTSIYSRDGDKIHVDDIASDMNFYMFKENGKNYTMFEGGEPTEEDFMYDMYANMIEMSLSMFVTGYYQAEDGDSALKYSAVRTDKKDGSSELVTSVSGESGEGTGEITTTGIKKDGKVRSIEVHMKSGDNDTQFNYEFDYDVTVEIPEHTIIDMSQFYHHVESPYANVEEVLKTLDDEEELNHMVSGDQLIVITEKDGHQYQLISQLSQEDLAEYEALDFFADDYAEKAFEIIRRQSFTDCIDFTEAVLSKEALDAYVGKTAGELADEGFENNGWFFGDSNGMSFEKDGMEYEAEVELPEGFDIDADFDYEDLRDAKIIAMRFSSPSYSILPME